MLALIFECGRVTSSWYAELALRRRVKKSAIGSVMVIGSVPYLSPAALLHAGQFARVRHLAQADPAQPELAEHRARTAAPVAAGVAAHRELRLAVGLVDQCLLRHCSVLLERKAEGPQQRSSF